MNPICIWFFVAAIFALPVLALDYKQHVAISSDWVLTNADFDMHVSGNMNGTPFDYKYQMELNRGIAVSAVYGAGAQDLPFSAEVELSYRYNSFRSIATTNLTLHDWIALLNAYYEMGFGGGIFKLFLAAGIGYMSSGGNGSYTPYNGGMDGFDGLEFSSFVYQVKFGYGLYVSSVVMLYSGFQFFGAPTLGKEVVYPANCGQRCPKSMNVSGIWIANSALESGIRYYF